MTDIHFYWYHKPHDYFMEIDKVAYANLDVGSNQRELYNTDYWWHEVDYWFGLKREVEVEETTATEIHKVMTKIIHERILGNLEW